jgi:hypothetical protein
VVTKPGIYTWEFQPFPTLLLSGQPWQMGHLKTQSSSGSTTLNLHCLLTNQHPTPQVRGHALCEMGRSLQQALSAITSLFACLRSWPTFPPYPPHTHTVPYPESIPHSWICLIQQRTAEETTLGPA